MLYRETACFDCPQEKRSRGRGLFSGKITKELLEYNNSRPKTWFRYNANKSGLKKLEEHFSSDGFKFHEELDQKNKPIIREVGKFGDKDWSISIGDVDE